MKLKPEELGVLPSNIAFPSTHQCGQSKLLGPAQAVAFESGT